MGSKSTTQEKQMALKISRAANLALSGMLTGTELGSWTIVHPALSRLPGADKIRAEQAVFRRYGKIMPVYMTATLLSNLPLLSLQRARSSAFRLSLASAICFSTMLFITLKGNVPINRRLLELDPETSQEEFHGLRESWGRLHSVRNLLNLSGLALACVAALSEPGFTKVAASAKHRRQERSMCSSWLR